MSEMSGEEFEREFYKNSMIYPNSKYIPEPRTSMRPHMNKWLFFKYTGPDVLKDGEGRDTGMLLHQLWAIRSDGRMYQSNVTETKLFGGRTNSLDAIHVQLRGYLETMLDAPATTDPV
jgi:hypothetical protein